MQEVKYTKDHEWLKLEEDGVAFVGISNHAQEELGDVVFVDLPTVGKTFNKGDAFAVVESVKAASDVYAPISFEVLGINASLGETPALVNNNAEGEGWFAKVKLLNDDFEGLMNKEEYESLLATL